MKKILLFILFCLISFSSQAQISFSIKSGALFTKSIYSLKDGDIISYYPEVAGFYHFNDRLSLAVGAGIKTVGNYQKATVTGWSGEINSNGDTISSNYGSMDIKARYIFSYFSVPITLSYKLDFRGTYAGVELGYQPNLNVLANKYIPDYPSEKIPYVNSMTNDILFVAKVGKEVSRDVYLELALRYCYALSDATEDGMFRRLDAVGLILGLNFMR